MDYENGLFEWHKTIVPNRASVTQNGFAWPVEWLPYRGENHSFYFPACQVGLGIASNPHLTMSGRLRSDLTGSRMDPVVPCTMGHIHNMVVVYVVWFTVQ